MDTFRMDTLELDSIAEIARKGNEDNALDILFRKFDDILWEAHYSGNWVQVQSLCDHAAAQVDYPLTILIGILTLTLCIKTKINRRALFEKALAFSSAETLQDLEP